MFSSKEIKRGNMKNYIIFKKDTLYLAIDLNEYQVSDVIYSLLVQNFIVTNIKIVAPDSKTALDKFHKVLSAYSISHSDFRGISV